MMRQHAAFDPAAVDPAAAVGPAAHTRVDPVGLSGNNLTPTRMSQVRERVFSSFSHSRSAESFFES